MYTFKQKVLMVFTFTHQHIIKAWSFKILIEDSNQQTITTGPTLTYQNNEENSILHSYKYSHHKEWNRSRKELIHMEINPMNLNA